MEIQNKQVPISHILTLAGISIGTAVGINIIQQWKNKASQIEQEKLKKALIEQQKQDQTKSETQKNQTLTEHLNLRLQLDQQSCLDTTNHLLNELKFLDSPTCDIIKVPHLAHYLQLDNFPLIVSPLLGDSKYRSVFGGEGFLPEESFLDARSFIINPAVFGPSQTIDRSQKYLRSGPRRNNFFNPQDVTAAIVTCGDLCPGLNAVIRELVLCLTYNYRANNIYGIQYGFKGFYSYEWIELTHLNTSGIHQQGGTILGTSTGSFDAVRIVDSLIAKNVNQVYVIGGDGAHRGIYELFLEIKKRQLAITIAGIPKTIDNDIPLIDRSFGFESAIQETQRAIQSANVEANCLEYGIGLVKLLGKKSGHIALHASLASRDVNICLIPEFEIDLYGPGGLFEFVYERLRLKKHCIIVVSEGAGLNINKGNLTKSTANNNNNNNTSQKPHFQDIGLFLSKELVSYCKSKGIDAQLKYIDPTDMIRTVPANSNDSFICSMIAQNAIHGSFAGFTCFTTANVNNKACYIPVDEISIKRQPVKVQPNDRAWQRLLATTGQPSFKNDETIYLGKIIPDFNTK